ncbi:response regulator [Lysobacter soli]|uniref:response regulator transcription factor n=1 Tax=Lysobacter soli TaxID=453783 RepID=UPI0012EDF999|nr:response regulator [Lysobacter soli]
MIRTLLVDDHAIVREGFKRLFHNTGRYEVVAEASDASQALEIVRLRPIDVAVIDPQPRDRRRGAPAAAHDGQEASQRATRRRQHAQRPRRGAAGPR